MAPHGEYSMATFWTPESSDDSPDSSWARPAYADLPPGK
jgi:hypothetical protein